MIRLPLRMIRMVMMITIIDEDHDHDDDDHDKDADNALLVVCLTLTVRPTKLGKKKDDMSFDDVRLSFMIMISLSTKCHNSNVNPNATQMQIYNDALTSLFLLRTTTTTW